MFTSILLYIIVPFLFSLLFTGITVYFMAETTYSSVDTYSTKKREKSPEISNEIPQMKKIVLEKFWNLIIIIGIILLGTFTILFNKYAVKYTQLELNKNYNVKNSEKIVVTDVVNTTDIKDFDTEGYKQYTIKDSKCVHSIFNKEKSKCYFIYANNKSKTSEKSYGMIEMTKETFKKYDKTTDKSLYSKNLTKSSTYKNMIIKINSNGKAVLGTTHFIKDFKKEERLEILYYSVLGSSFVRNNEENYKFLYESGSILKNKKSKNYINKYNVITGLNTEETYDFLINYYKDLKKEKKITKKQKSHIENILEDLEDSLKILESNYNEGKLGTSNKKDIKVDYVTSEINSYYELLEENNKFESPKDYNLKNVNE